ncbi:MAG TPA: fatty acid CoA ligase family protein [Solirubrobacterales bacterium]
MGVVAQLESSAMARPRSAALIAGGRSVSFAELVERIGRDAARLRAAGVGRGHRVAFMVPPGIDSMTLLFGLLKIGAVPVFVDAGIDLRNLRRCLEEAAPEVFLGDERTLAAQARFGWGEGTIRLRLASDGSSGVPLPEATATGDGAAAEAGPEEEAIVLFTTGSTGPPKGAVYTGATVAAQQRALTGVFGWSPDGVDMPTLPTFAPYAIAAGTTVLIPEMDFTEPGKADPESLLEQMQRHRVATFFGSPALLDRLARHGAGLPGVRRVLTAGAPALPSLLERFAPLLDEGATLVTLYGATEAIPIGTIEAAEALAEAPAWAAGEGICLGHPEGSVAVAAIPIATEPPDSWSPSLRLATGEAGELVVKGPTVSPRYAGRPEASRLAKIPDAADGLSWHRTGDAVRIDDRGRLWMLGRVGHRVTAADGEMHSLPSEAIFDQHPRIRRSALIGVGQPGAQRPVVCFEPAPGQDEAGEELERLRAELRELGAARPHTAAIEDFLPHPGLPVDIRHNSKIFREKLVPWAAERLRADSAGETGDRRIEVAREVFARFSRRDPSFLEQVDPDVEVEVPPTLPGGGRMRGQRRLIEFLESMEIHFEGQEMDLEKFIDAGEEIVILGLWRAAARRTGVSLEVPIAMRWGFRDGLVCRYQSYIDTATIQAAIAPVSDGEIASAASTS